MRAIEPTCVDVVEHQAGSGELRGVEHVVDHGGSEGESSGPDEGDLGRLHLVCPSARLT